MVPYARRRRLWGPQWCWHNLTWPVTSPTLEAHSGLLRPYDLARSQQPTREPFCRPPNGCRLPSHSGHRASPPRPGLPRRVPIVAVANARASWATLAQASPASWPLARSTAQSSLALSISGTLCEKPHCRSTPQGLSWDWAASRLAKCPGNAQTPDAGCMPYRR